MKTKHNIVIALALVSVAVMLCAECGNDKDNGRNRGERANQQEYSGTTHCGQGGSREDTWEDSGGQSSQEPVPAPSITTFVDKRDGRTYKKVTIGTQTWMAENLNYAGGGGTCYGEGRHTFIGFNVEGYDIRIRRLSDEEIRDYCARYGRLYDWSAALTACPTGWHLPSDAEWTAMTDYVGGAKTANKKLKSAAGWKDGGNGTDDYGFSGLPGGYGDLKQFCCAGSYGGWWSATESDDTFAWRWFMYYRAGNVGRLNFEKTYQFSVRCVQDDVKGNGDEN